MHSLQSPMVSAYIHTAFPYLRATDLSLVVGETEAQNGGVVWQQGQTVWLIHHSTSIPRAHQVLGSEAGAPVDNCLGSRFKFQLFHVLAVNLHLSVKWKNSNRPHWVVMRPKWLITCEALTTAHDTTWAPITCWLLLIAEANQPKWNSNLWPIFCLLIHTITPQTCI